MERKKRIMVVDDELGLLKMIQLVLIREGYEVEVFNDPQRAIDRICENPENIDRPEFILTDLDLGKGYTGIKIIQVAREFWNDIPAAIMSGGFPSASEEGCRRLTPYILLKPFILQELTDFVQNAMVDALAHTSPKI